LARAAAHWLEPYAFLLQAGARSGVASEVQPQWEAAVTAGAAMVLNGHDHDYEWFAALHAAGDPVPHGTAEFVTGLVGHQIRALSGTLGRPAQRHSGGAVPRAPFRRLLVGGKYGRRARGGTWRGHAAVAATLNRAAAVAG
jgi:hypothetical protein